jgi:hypothetical protein
MSDFARELYFWSVMTLAVLGEGIVEAVARVMGF